MSSAALRKQRQREREREGRAVLRVNVRLADLADALVDEGLLPGWDCEDRDAIERAVERMIELLLVTRDRLGR